MNNINSLIENQYNLPGLYEEILSRLKELGVDLENVSRSSIAGVDEFHVRGSQVSEELVKEVNIRGFTVLDVGCGLGGPSRMLADEFDCNVYGIDMSEEYIRTAKKLSELVRLDEKTNFVKGNALELPYENRFFDVVWTQHVQMNVEDKNKFYAEISRVLKDDGILVYYDIFKINNKDLIYPVPWANDPSVSFLGTTSNMDNILKKLGFANNQKTNQSDKAIEFLKNLFEKIKKNGPPKLGLNVLMGTSTKEKLGNILTGIEDGAIELQSGVYKK